MASNRCGSNSLLLLLVADDVMWLLLLLLAWCCATAGGMVPCTTTGPLAELVCAAVLACGGAAASMGAAPLTPDADRSDYVVKWGSVNGGAHANTSTNPVHTLPASIEMSIVYPMYCVWQDSHESRRDRCCC